MPVEGKRGNYIALAVTLSALGALLLALMVVLVFSDVGKLIR